MLFKRDFKKFDFRGFVDFIHDLFNEGLGEIRFHPVEHPELFNDIQLTHIAPSWDINNSNGFVWAWKQKYKEVRRVSFDLFAINGRPKITMTIDLDKKFIALDVAEGISPVQVEEALRKNLGISTKRKWYYRFANILKKYIPQIIVGLGIGLIAAFLIYKFGWNR